MGDLVENRFSSPTLPKRIPEPITQEGIPERQMPIDAMDQLTGRMMRGAIRQLAKDEVKEQLKALSARPNFIKINTLPNKLLRLPIDVVVEPDDHGFLARTADLPLYGYGDDPVEAVQMLKREIESLYNDLLDDDSFNEEHLRLKEFLKAAIAD